MRELFGMSARFPATATLSMEAPARHGGQSDEHRDGWGVALISGPDVHCAREPCPAAERPALRFMTSHDYRGRLVLAPIRLATAGELLVLRDGVVELRWMPEEQENRHECRG